MRLDEVIAGKSRNELGEILLTILYTGAVTFEDVSFEEAINMLVKKIVSMNKNIEQWAVTYRKISEGTEAAIYTGVVDAILEKIIRTHLTVPSEPIRMYSIAELKKHVSVTNGCNHLINSIVNLTSGMIMYTQSSDWVNV